MANNFTFQAALKLNSAGFKKGVASVQKSLEGLYRSFLTVAGALGAGLGFAQLTSKLKDTAVQLSVAKNTLENVSRVSKTYQTEVGEMTTSISNYGENMEFVKKVSKEYSQDLVALTQNFAQFHAACEGTNLSLENQKLVFESLTRAAAYYHMTSDRTKDMMNAVTQMMSKGRVAAEELRRQLGNSLPGAFNLMAASMGVSTAQLDDMMRKGQVIAADVLPKFAAMLNQVTKDAHFDSLQMSLNSLKNTWYELVEASGAEGFFDKIVKGTDKVLGGISRNFTTIISAVKGLIAGILSFKLFDTLKKRGDAYFEGQARRLHKLEMSYKSAYSNIEKITAKDPKSVRIGAHTDIAWAFTKDKQVREEVLKYNKALYETERIKREVYNTPMMSDKDFGRLEAYNARLEASLVKQGALEKKSRGLFATLGAGIRSIGVQLKGLLASMGWMALFSLAISAITAIISHVKELKERWAEVNSMVDNYHKEVDAVDVQTQKSEMLLRSRLRIIESEASGEREKLMALKEINKMMGSNFTTDAIKKETDAYKKLVAEVNRWVDATKLQAKIQVQAQKGAEAQAQIEKIRADLVVKQKKYNSLTVTKGRDDYGNPVVGPKRPVDALKVKNLKEEIELDKASIKQLTTIVNQADAALDELGVTLADVMDVGKKDEPKEGDITKVYKKYTEDLKELNNKLKEHAITEAEYNDEFDKLVQKYWESAAGTGGLSISEILKKVKKGETLTALEKWYKDLKEAAEAAAKRTVFSEMVDDVLKEIEDSLKESEKEFEDEVKKMSEKEREALEATLAVTDAKTPKRGKRNPLFDYSKSQSDIYGEELDLTKDQISKLEELIEEFSKVKEKSETVKRSLAVWNKMLKEAKVNAENFEQAMTIAKLQEDFKEIQKSIWDTTYGGIKDMAQGADRLVRATKALGETLENADATGWEKITETINLIFQYVDTIWSMLKTVGEVMDLKNQRTQNEIALQAALSGELSIQNGLLKERNDLELQHQELVKGSAILEAAEAATTKLQADANKKEAGSAAAAAIGEGAKSGAKLPFPYNIAAVATAVAAIVGALAAMSQFQKFAKGGIVGGNSAHGDRNLIRANSGELILNKAQQGTLYRAIASGNLGGNGNVQFTIRGADLVGTLNNYNRLRK